MVAVALGSPIDGVAEIAGPQQFRLDELVRTVLAGDGDIRSVVTDPHATYFGAELEERTLLPDNARELGTTTLSQWLPANPRR